MNDKRKSKELKLFETEMKKLIEYKFQSGYLLGREEGISQRTADILKMIDELRMKSKDEHSTYHNHALDLFKSQIQNLSPQTKLRKGMSGDDLGSNPIVSEDKSVDTRKGKEKR